MRDRKTAEQTDWKNLLMPEEQTTIQLDRRFSGEELEKIK